MKILCELIGHKEVVRDFYPNDTVISIACRRCGVILKAFTNPGYTGHKILEQMVCFNAAKNSFLTDGKIYKIHNQRDGMFCVVNDNRELRYYSMKQFVTLKEGRRIKLKKLKSL